MVRTSHIQAYALVAAIGLDCANLAFGELVPAADTRISTMVPDFDAITTLAFAAEEGATNLNFNRRIGQVGSTFSIDASTATEEVNEISAFGFVTTIGAAILLKSPLKFAHPSGAAISLIKCPAAAIDWCGPDTKNMTTVPALCPKPDCEPLCAGDETPEGCYWCTNSGVIHCQQCSNDWIKTANGSCERPATTTKTTTQACPKAVDMCGPDAMVTSVPEYCPMPICLPLCEAAEIPNGCHWCTKLTGSEGNSDTRCEQCKEEWARAADGTCELKVFGWPTGEASEFESVTPAGWCVDSLGLEIKEKRLAQGDVCKTLCSSDETCPAYVMGASDGSCLWYTDKRPDEHTVGHKALTFFVASGVGNTSSQKRWSTATCFRKKLPFVDDKTTLSPPFVGAFVVSQAALECSPSHCFENGNGHAVDWAMRKGNRVLAARGGMVVFVDDMHDDGGPCGWDGTVLKSYRPNLISVKHNDHTEGVYVHLLAGTAIVKVGDWVKRGTVLAESGNSGCSSGPHLHLHVKQENSSHTMPMRFDFPCQNEFDIAPATGEWHCNTKVCECRTCWHTWYQSGARPPFMEDRWKSYCSSSSNQSFFAMTLTCSAVFHDSDEALSIQMCERYADGLPCYIFDTNREGCSREPPCSAEETPEGCAWCIKSPGRAEPNNIQCKQCKGGWIQHVDGTCRHETITTTTTIQEAATNWNEISYASRETLGMFVIAVVARLPGCVY